ncbi:MAG: transporter substrate-binding domain-containing protein [Candidatus Heimdallarchaeota archaeon]|nr:transporter substrate-binding domain-containing protein [Candidatus Heimdallarchaeota archaeon]
MLLPTATNAQTLQIVVVSDANVAGIKIGVQTGTTSDIYGQFQLPLATIVGYDTILLAETALEIGDVHLIMGDKPVLDQYVSTRNDFAILDSFSEELFGLAVDDGETDLLMALNTALGEIFTDTGIGGYDDIYDNWFEDLPALYDDTTGAIFTYPVAPATGDLAAILTGKVIRFGTDPTFPPFELETTTGQYEGFDIDIMNAITAKFSAEYGGTFVAKVVPSDWDRIIPNLINGEFDVILSAMTITPEREQVVDFTRAYYASIQSIVGPADGIITLGAESTTEVTITEVITTVTTQITSTSTITTISTSPLVVHINIVSDANVAGIKIGVQSGTTSDIYGTNELPHAEILGYDTILLAETALEIGDVHLIMGDKPVLDLYVSTHSAYAVLDSFSEELFGLAVDEGEIDLLMALNAALGEIIMDTGTGGYDDIYDDWFTDLPALYDDTNGATFMYPASPATGDLATILTSKQIRFGMDPTYPPFERETTSGGYEGFDIDIMNAIANKFSVEYGGTFEAKVVPSAWDPIIPNLNNDEFDVILSAMTITAEREQVVDFTRAYYASIQAIVGPSDGIINLGSDSSTTVITTSSIDDTTDAIVTDSPPSVIPLLVPWLIMVVPFAMVYFSKKRSL